MISCGNESTSDKESGNQNPSNNNSDSNTNNNNNGNNSNDNVEDNLTNSNLESQYLDKLNKAYLNFNIIPKSSTDCSLLEAKEIVDESSLLKYFILSGLDSDITYTFVNAAIDGTDYTCLFVSYKIAYKSYTRDKLIKLTGFALPDNLTQKQKNTQMLKSLEKNLKIISNSEENAPDYRNITVMNFLTLLSTEPWQIYDYFEINSKELEEIYQSNPFQSNDCDINFQLKNGYKFNPENPTSIVFQVKVKIGKRNKYDNIDTDDPNYVTETFDYTLDGFKLDPEYIGKLDAQPIDKLPTPANAISYKGKLETFKISNIKRTNHQNYVNAQNKFTWDDFKKEIMYHLRFYLYQMFSDNFTEINYYVNNEIVNEKLVATAEGIIKENKTNFSAYFQLINDRDYTNKYNVQAGDKIKIQFEYVSKNWKPIALDSEEILPGLIDKNFDFSSSCDLIGKNPSKILTNTFFSSITSDSKMNLSVFQNDKNIIYVSPNIMEIWSFVIRQRII